MTRLLNQGTYRKLSLKNRLTCAFLAIFSFFLFSSLPLYSSENYTGVVEKVSDGDTITVLTTDYERIKVRFYGIDAPEKAQPYGSSATNALASLVDRKNVEVEVIDIDRYSRMVALVRVNGELINLEMVASGNAWVYDQYCQLSAVCASLNTAQKEAQAAGKGLWADPSPTPPWLFRRGQRGNGTQSSTPSSSETISGQRRGNANSKIFHNSSCIHFNCKNCTITFSNAQEAIRAGYRACRLCGG